MLDQKNFTGDKPTIVNANEPHMACLLLVDTSGSMGGEPIAELNEGLNRFKQQVCEDKTTRGILDVAIVAFNSSIKIVQDFVPIEYMEPVNLVADGGTNMAPAIELSMEMVNERSRFYRRSGTEPYKPWVIMISDGFGGNVSVVAEKIRDMESNDKLKFFSLGVEGYDSGVLHQLSGEKVMKLKDYDFTSFFDWVNKSMRAVSQSSPGEKPRGVPLPENIDKDTNSWM